MRLSKGLKQAYDMQDIAYNAAMALREQLAGAAPGKEDAAIIAQLGKVWRDAQEQIRIHRGKPLPGSLVHEKVSRKSKVAPSISLLNIPTGEPEASEPPAGEGK